MALLREFTLKTPRNGFYSITREVSAFVEASAVTEGIAVVFCPHTTAGITLNEDADPDVLSDLTRAMDRVSPKLPEYRHLEGNSDAHFKSTLTGAAATLLIHGGKLLLGRWQGIYFCEFDAPRSRKYLVKLLEG